MLSGDDNITLPLMSVGGRGVDLRHRQHRAARDLGDDPRRARRRLEARARAALPALPAVAGRVHRDESHPRQGSDGDDGHDRARVPAAHVPHGRGEPRALRGILAPVRARQAADAAAARMADVVGRRRRRPDGQPSRRAAAGGQDLRLAGALEAPGTRRCGGTPARSRGSAGSACPSPTTPRACSPASASSSSSRSRRRASSHLRSGRAARRRGR